MVDPATPNRHTHTHTHTHSDTYIYTYIPCVDMEVDETATPRFKTFTEEVQNVLAQFDRVREWADLSRCLQRLQKSFVKFEDFSTIPEKVTVSKRLAQCLNPALPGGVHMKVLELYALILMRLEPATLAIDLPLYSVGLLPYFARASVQIRPQVLCVLREHVVDKLGSQLKGALSGFVMSLVPGMEEPGTETFDKVRDFLDYMEERTDTPSFLHAIFEGILLCPQYRMGSFNYLNDRLYRDGSKGVKDFMISRSGVFVKALAASIRDDVMLVQRGALDFVCAMVPLNSEDFSVHHKQLLIDAAIPALVSREIPVMRRFFSWLYGGGEFDQTYFETHAKHLLIHGLQSLLLEGAQESLALRHKESASQSVSPGSTPISPRASSSKPDPHMAAFRICSNIIKRQELVDTDIARRLLIPALRSLRLAENATPDIFERLFELWPQAVVWEGVEELLLSCTSLQQPGVEPFHMLLDTIETLPRTDELTWNHFPRMLLIVFHFCEQHGGSADFLLLYAALQLGLKLISKMKLSYGIEAMLPAYVDIIHSRLVFQKFFASFFHLRVHHLLQEDGSSSCCHSDEDELSDLPEIFRLIGNLQVIMETSIASEAAMFAIENAPLLQAERGGEPLRGPSELHPVLGNCGGDIVGIRFVDTVKEYLLSRGSRPADTFPGLHYEALLLSCQIPDVYLASTGIRCFLDLFIQPSKGVSSKLRHFIVHGTDAPRVVASQLWHFLALDAAAHHFEAAKMFTELSRICEDTCQRVITDDLIRRDEFRNFALEPYNRFALFWRLLDELSPSERGFNGLSLMLDTLHSHQPELQLLGRTWLRDSVVSNINRLLDPLLLLCFDQEFLAFGKRDNSQHGDRYSKLQIMFDEGRVLYTLNNIHSILEVCPGDFFESISGRPVSADVFTLFSTHVCHSSVFENEHMGVGSLSKPLVPASDYLGLLLSFCSRMALFGHLDDFPVEDMDRASAIRIQSVHMLRSILFHIRPMRRAVMCAATLANSALHHLRRAVEVADPVLQVHLLALIRAILGRLFEYDCATATENGTSSKDHGSTWWPSSILSLFPQFSTKKESEESADYDVIFGNEVEYLESGMSPDSFVTSPHFLHILHAGLAGAIQRSATMQRHDNPLPFLQESSSGVFAEESGASSLLQYWMDYVVSFLPLLNSSLFAVLSTLVPNISEMITRIASDGIDAVTSSELLCLLRGLTQTITFCLLDYEPRQGTKSELGSLFDTSSGRASPADSGEPDGAGEKRSKLSAPLRLISDFFNFSGDSGKGQTERTAKVEAHAFVFNSLPTVLKALFTVWNSLRTPSVSKGAAPQLPRLGSLHAKRGLERPILRFVDPLLVHFPLQLLSGIASWWGPSVLYNHQNGRSQARVVIEVLNCVDSATPDSICDSLFSLARYAAQAQGRKATRKKDNTSHLSINLQKVSLVNVYSLLFSYVQHCAMPERLSVALPMLIAHMKEILSSSSSFSHVHPWCWTTLLRTLMEVSRRSADVSGRKPKRDIQDVTGKFADFTVSACIRQFREEFKAGAGGEGGGRFLERDVDSQRPSMEEDADMLEDHAESSSQLDSTMGAEEGPSSSGRRRAESMSGVRAASAGDAPKFCQSEHDLDPLASLADYLCPFLDSLFEDKDRMTAVMAAVVQQLVPLIRPYSMTKQRFLSKHVYAGVLLLATFVEYPFAVKSYKKEVWDIFLDPKFFETEGVVAGKWKSLVHAVMCQEKPSFNDLLAKFTTSQMNVFSSKEAEGLLRARLLQRISFAVFAAPQDHYLPHLTAIQERLVECLRGSFAGAYPSVQRQVFFCLRILISRITPQNLISFWPLILTELIRVFSERKAEATDLAVVAEALKFIEFAMLILPGEFQLYAWMFLGSLQQSSQFHGLHSSITTYEDGMEGSRESAVVDVVSSEFLSSLNQDSPLIARQATPLRSQMRKLFTRARAQASTIAAIRLADVTTMTSSQSSSSASLADSSVVAAVEGGLVGSSQQSLVPGEEHVLEDASLEEKDVLEHILQLWGPPSPSTRVTPRGSNAITQHDLPASGYRLTSSIAAKLDLITEEDFVNAASAVQPSVFSIVEREDDWVSVDRVPSTVLLEEDSGVDGEVSSSRAEAVPQESPAADSMEEGQEEVEVVEEEEEEEAVDPLSTGNIAVSSQDPVDAVDVDGDSQFEEQIQRLAVPEETEEDEMEDVGELGVEEEEEEEEEVSLEVDDQGKEHALPGHQGEEEELEVVPVQEGPSD